MAGKGLLNALQQDWRRLNHLHFDGELRPPVMELINSRTRLGYWESKTRRMAFSLSLVMSRPWGEVMEVLRHEMAHQYVDEILKVRSETAHGPRFREICEQLGIHSGAQFQPQGGLDEERARQMRKVKALMALAEGGSEHEARSALQMAQRLMLEHNLELSEPAQYSFLQLGVPTKRRPGHTKMLAGLLLSHFFVEGIWVEAYDPRRAKRGWVLEIHGSQENLEVAEWIWSSLQSIGERLWKQHRKRTDCGGRERGPFLSGLIHGFQEQLEAQRQRQQEEGLVWVGDPALVRYMAARHPRVHRGRRFSLRQSEAYLQGQREGRKLKLQRPIQGKSGGQRLLTDRGD